MGHDIISNAAFLVPSILAAMKGLLLVVFAFVFLAAASAYYHGGNDSKLDVIGMYMVFTALIGIYTSIPSSIVILTWAVLAILEEQLDLFITTGVLSAFLLISMFVTLPIIEPLLVVAIFAGALFIRFKLPQSYHPYWHYTSAIGFTIIILLW